MVETFCSSRIWFVYVRSTLHLCSTGPPSGLRECVNGPFQLRECVKIEKKLRECVNVESLRERENSFFIA